jgi:hypothetical protein
VQQFPLKSCGLPRGWRGAASINQNLRSMLILDFCSARGGSWPFAEVAHRPLHGSFRMRTGLITIAFWRRCLGRIALSNIEVTEKRS